MDALKELREKVGDGTPSEKIEARLLGFAGKHWPQVLNAASGSLDAAKALHEALLPGWEVNASMSPCQGGWETAINLWNGRMAPDSCEVIILDHEADTPARAWLLAILDALIAKETDDAEHS